VKVTFLSNGHGEDAIATLLARELLRQEPSFTVQAYPMVNEGHAYEALGVPILGPSKRMPSGGLLIHTWEMFVQDIQAGFIPMTLTQLADLWKLKTDVLIVVGDLYALALSSLVKTKCRFYVQSLVSTRHSSSQSQLNRYFMENISYSERALMRHNVHQAYLRDEATAERLKAKGLTRVSYLGNPMLDALQGRAMSGHAKPMVALLPGTRNYAVESLKIMLGALKVLPNVTGLVAWSGGELPELSEWQIEADYSQGPALKLRCEQSVVYIYEGRFADILHSADIVLGTSGTANEQAAALGKPVIAFAVPPIYSLAFIKNQQRLLGDALVIAESRPDHIAQIVNELLEDASRYKKAARAGPERMGKPGGSAAIVADILERLKLY
jgi:uncharacterized protein (TIGR03492 family)